MVEWLAHPQELGKNPAKIQLAGEFDMDGMHYYIFKYKKSILGKWLLGVCGEYEGETIGFTPEQHFSITRSRGVAVSGEFLKISF